MKIRNWKTGLVLLLGLAMPLNSFGGGTNIVKRITKDTTTTLHWQKQYKLQAASSDSSRGYVTGNVDSWIAQGGTGTVEVAVSDPYSMFAGWSGDVSGIDTNDSTLEIIVNKPRSLTANFTADYSSYPYISAIAPTNGGNKVRCENTADSYYFDLEKRESLTGGSWTNAVSRVLGTGLSPNLDYLEFFDADSSPVKFYRVRAEKK